MASDPPPFPRVPTLLVRATEPITGLATDGDWRAHWPVPHTTVEVPGNHFTMLEDHAAATARAVHKWVATLWGATSAAT